MIWKLPVQVCPWAIQLLTALSRADEDRRTCRHSVIPHVPRHPDSPFLLSPSEWGIGGRTPGSRSPLEITTRRQLMALRVCMTEVSRINHIKPFSSIPLAKLAEPPSRRHSRGVRFCNHWATCLSSLWFGSWQNAFLFYRRRLFIH